MKKLVFVAVLISFLGTSVCFADEDSTAHTPEPYTDDEFPLFMKDIRRTEIITLGAMPFITLHTTLAYSFIRYCQHDFSSDYTPNPFAKSSDTNGFSQNEQGGILLTALGISIGIGLTDLTFTIIRQAINKRKTEKTTNKSITVTPVEEDKDAVPLPPPPEEHPDDSAESETPADYSSAAGSSVETTEITVHTSSSADSSTAGE